jgi:hypothetical protein
MATKTSETPAKFESNGHDGKFYMSFTGATVADPPSLESVLTAMGPHALNMGWRLTGVPKHVGTRDLDTDNPAVTAARSVYTFAAPCERNNTENVDPTQSLPSVDRKD